MPRSAISGLGCRSGGKPAAMYEPPSRTVPRSAISGLGCRSGGKPAVMHELPKPDGAAIGDLGLGLP